MSLKRKAMLAAHSNTEQMQQVVVSHAFPVQTENNVEITRHLHSRWKCFNIS